MNYYDKLAALLLKTGAHTATKYLSPSHIVRVTRKKHKCGFDKHQLTFIITDCQPNYRERLFIKTCKKAKEPFPVKKIQLKFLAARK